MMVLWDEPHSTRRTVDSVPKSEKLGHSSNEPELFDSYHELELLGRDHFTRKIPSVVNGEKVFMVKYTQVGSIELEHVDTCATTTTSHIIHCRVGDHQIGVRRFVHLTESRLAKPQWNAFIGEVQKATAANINAIVRAFKFEKVNVGSSANLNTGSLTAIVRRYMGDNRVTRLCILGLLKLFADVCGRAIRIRKPEKLSVEVVRYTLEETVRVAGCVNQGNTSEIITDQIDVNSLMILLQCVVRMPHTEIYDRVHGYLKMGGFAIEGEVDLEKPDPRVMILYKGDLPFNDGVRLDGYVDVTSADIYKTFARYAITVDDCAALKTGMALAHVLFHSDGLVSFSLPKTNAIGDLLIGAMNRTGTNEMIPFLESGVVSVGAIVSKHQILSMVADVYNHLTPFELSDDGNAPLASKLGRSNVYYQFQKNNFSGAFGICKIIDPLNVTEKEEKSALMSKHYCKHFWSLDAMLCTYNNSCQEKVAKGMWKTLDEARQAGVADQNRAVANYIIYEMVPQTRTRGLTVDVELLDEDANYRKVKRELKSGQFRCNTSEVIVPLDFMKPASKKDWNAIDIPDEVPHLDLVRDGVDITVPNRLYSYRLRGGKGRRKETADSIPQSKLPDEKDDDEPYILVGSERSKRVNNDSSSSVVSNEFEDASDAIEVEVLLPRQSADSLGKELGAVMSQSEIALLPDYARPSSLPNASSTPLAVGTEVFNLTAPILTTKLWGQRAMLLNYIPSTRK